MNAVYMSIKDIHISKIVNKTKIYEYRNYIPKREFNRLYIYVPVPVCELKYILDIESIVSYPDKIKDISDGTNDFNKGIKPSNAYKVGRVYKLVNPIPLKLLKEKFGFTAPQGFAYDDRYKELTDYIEIVDKEIIW